MGRVRFGMQGWSRDWRDRTRCCLLHRAHDAVVARAAAEIPRQSDPDLVLPRARLGGEKRRRGDEHARRAEATLDATLLEERPLQRAEPVLAGEALPRRDALPSRLD